jgi:hypothetical protein
MATEPLWYTLNDCKTDLPYEVSGQILYIRYLPPDPPVPVLYPPSYYEDLIVTQITVNGLGSLITGCFNITRIIGFIPPAFYNWIITPSPLPMAESCLLCDPEPYILKNCSNNLPVTIGGENVYIINNGEPGPAGLFEDYVEDGITELFIEPSTPIWEGCAYFELTNTIPDEDVIKFEWQEVTALTSVASCQICNPPLPVPVCFKLINCKTEQELVVSYSSVLFDNYQDEKIIKITGNDGCWEIEALYENCECAVAVTVSESFNDCPSCLPIIAYKFTSCDNQYISKYSTEDFSEYVGKTVQLDCDDCWTVSKINYTPPSTQPIVIDFVFKNCTDCKKTYYKLVDCTSPNNIIYTDTDVFEYLGKIIKIKGYKTCFEIDGTTREPVNPISILVTNEYDTCPECNPQVDCICNKITNFATTAKTYEYIDCNDKEFEFTLEPNASSSKRCVKQWKVTWPETDSLQTFGDCLVNEETDSYYCPLDRSNRKIKPGYSVPSCDPEKYEKYACKSSEIFYKIVLEKRYGISNCCPDIDAGEKWIIKKELADLQGTTDPDYECTPVQSCCDNTSTCGCGCNTTLKSCSTNT